MVNTDFYRGRPENTGYDRQRHEEMRLKPLGSYGIVKLFVNGTKESPWCTCGCDRRKVWCPNNEINKIA